MERIQTSVRSLEKEGGQMLLLVLVVLLLLFVIVLAIVVNVRTDIKETQSEREYEKGYAIAEQSLFQISADGIEAWKASVTYVSPVPGYLSSFCPSGFTCYKSCDAVSTDNCVIVKTKGQSSIDKETIMQDSTLEVYAVGATGQINVSWDGAAAMSIILVCKDGSGAYSSNRMAVCRSGSGSCDGITGISGFKAITDAQAATGPLNMANGCPSGVPELMRFRAISGDATNVSITGNLPTQVTEVRVQGFSAGLNETNKKYESLPAPEVYTTIPVRKQLPALFDYVLFVANGAVSKT